MTIHFKDKYTFREQVNGRGCYASIDFEIIFDPKDDFIHNLEVIYNGDPKWEVLCKAGISIFNEYYSKINRGNLKIQVQEVKYLDIDSNNLIVLFSTVKGLCELLNFNIDSLVFDKNLESFIFPELRSLTPSSRSSVTGANNENKTK